MGELNKALGRRMYTLRTAKGFSQEKLAEKVGMSVKHLGEIERGVTNASIQCLADIAQALDITIRNLLEIEHEKHSKELLAELAATIPKLPPKDIQVVYRLVKALSEY